MVQLNMEETSHFRDKESDDRRARETPPYLVETIRSMMKDEIRSYKENNENIIRAQEK
jgi:hypothetical protein